MKHVVIQSAAFYTDARTGLDLICNKSEGKCSILVLLDLSAAFDTVDHHTLLCDLENLCITEIALSWFKTYHTDRNFKVIVNDEGFEIVNMKYGVPLSTILGIGTVHYSYANPVIYAKLLQCNVSFLC